MHEVGLAQRIVEIVAGAVASQPGARAVSARLLLGDGPAALDLADLAAIGTVADVAPILGENRAIVRLGLDRIRAGARPGIAALLARANVTAAAAPPGSLQRRGRAFAPCQAEVTRPSPLGTPAISPRTPRPAKRRRRHERPIAPVARYRCKRRRARAGRPARRSLGPPARR